MNTNCELVSPSFFPGHSYLIFLGIAADTKQFDEVSGAEDKWLQFVEAHLRLGGASNAIGGRPHF